ncbi:MAG TPA: hypothetical protein ENJ45_00475 [Phaeodactylibacter sp.]|nr:hypothetical protein [Phaeodactylibacter sp.]
MKKLLPIIALITLLFSTQNLQAQNVTREEVEFKKGDIELTAGVGLLSTFVSKNTKSRIIPLSFSFHYRIKQFLSVGMYSAFSSTNGFQPESDTKNDEIPIETAVVRNDFYLVGARLEGHFNKERIDFYGGAMLGYSFSDVSKLNPDVDRVEGIIIREGLHKTFTYSGYVGLKYMLTKHFGIFGEIGYGASLVNIGLTSKF